MGVILVYPSAVSDGSASLPNSDTLRKLSTDSNGNLCFNGHVIASTSIETTYNLILTDIQVQQNFFALPDDCDPSQAITLSLNGISFPRGDFWEVIEKSYPEYDLISWVGLELQHLVQVGDSVFISYYKKI